MVNARLGFVCSTRARTRAGLESKRGHAVGFETYVLMSTIPHACHCVINPLIASARETLERCASLVPVAFVGNRTTEEKRSGFRTAVWLTGRSRTSVKDRIVFPLATTDITIPGSPSENPVIAGFFAFAQNP